MNELALIPAVFGGVMVFVGFVFWLICRFLDNGRMDQTTTGQVVDVTLDDVGFNTEQGQLAKPHRVSVRLSTGTGHNAIYHKVYTYTVGTVTYTRADSTCYSSGLARAAIGREVTVHYDSSDPGDSSLGGAKALVYVYRILFGIGSALLALAAWIWLRG